MHYLTSKEAAAILGCSPKNVTLLCAAGKFPGVKKVPGRKTEEWRIPAQSVIDYQMQKEVDVEVFPPESHELVTRQSLLDLFAEIERRNETEHAETRMMVEESRGEIAERLREKDEEISELRGILAKNQEENSEEMKKVWGKVERIEEQTKKKPGWFARLLGRG